MRITKVKLNNYLCFYDVPEFELGPGINLIVGKNNSGKTTLINALSLVAPASWHKSPVTVPAPNTYPQANTKRGVVFEFAWPEMTIVRSLNFHIESIQDRLDYIYSEEEIECLTRKLSEGLRVRLAYEGSWEGPTKHDNLLFDLETDSQQRPPYETIKQQLSDLLCVPSEIAHALVYMSNSLRFSRTESMHENVFKFNAERLVRATGLQSADSVLASDASNLPQVLRTLLGNDSFAFSKYAGAVNRVLPEILDLRLLQNDDETTTIMVNNYEPSARRPDLAASLDLSGTGVGHVMGMLYEVIFHDESNPRIILIDEPNAFLHPGAIRRLLEVFQENDHHQYIIATHSPSAIMTVQKKTMLLVTRKNKISTVNSVDVENNTELEEALKEIGTKRSDIFGMDAVIWVEGKTDATCFKMIMDGEKENGRDGLPDGVNVLELVNTGDLEDEQHAVLAVEIYQKLSGGVGLLPSALAFVFDGDKDKENKKFPKKLLDSGRIRFLSRQNFESYFLEFPEILADILNHDAADDKPKDRTAESVKRWIRKQESKEYDDHEWLESVDGAKLLNKMFQDLAGISYKGNKVQYGEEITKRILTDDPNHFQEIVDLIKDILDSNTASTQN
ncbi:MAG: AAA family ATPase [Chloroflexi bacterium]|nr:AAA family ATPase [Chloroflexota bacterium]